MDLPRFSAAFSNLASDHPVIILATLLWFWTESHTTPYPEDHLLRDLRQLAPGSVGRGLEQFLKTQQEAFPAILEYNPTTRHIKLVSDSCFFSGESCESDKEWVLQFLPSLTCIYLNECAQLLTQLHQPNHQQPAGRRARSVSPSFDQSIKEDEISLREQIRRGQELFRIYNGHLSDGKTPRQAAKLTRKWDKDRKQQNRDGSGDFNCNYRTREQRSGDFKCNGRTREQRQPVHCSGFWPRYTLGKRRHPPIADANQWGCRFPVRRR
ncbi:hypothetical protein DFJ77DRAFT_343525 [Powellomyces hirtus]|nr:hypothetical protein DFJ77DRAFT_343525 [Powellomyces hirtus]